MSKEHVIGLGLIGVPFMVVGAIIGGRIVEKQHSKFPNIGMEVWKSMSEFLKEQLYKSWDENEKLKKQLESKEV